ncbi:hypothetical protein N9N71_02965 [Synechococcus sp. AH-229-G18]|nr:hypothetical protein [Synechococcus sp. AH-229-G18]
MNKARGFLSTLIDEGFIVEEGNSWTLCFPERVATEEEANSEPQAKTKQTKVLEAAKPAAAIRKVEVDVVDVEQVTVQPAPRKVAPIIRHSSEDSPAPELDIIDECVKAWNDFNDTKGGGFYYKNVNRRGFPEGTIETVKKFSKKYFFTPTEIVKRALSLGMDADRGWVTRPNSQPSYVLGALEENFEGVFYEEQRAYKVRETQPYTYLGKSFSQDYPKVMGEIISLKRPSELYWEVLDADLFDKLKLAGIPNLGLAALDARNMSAVEVRGNILSLMHDLKSKITASAEYQNFKLSGSDLSSSMQYFPIFGDNPVEAFIEACHHYEAIGSEVKIQAEG